VGSLVKNTFNRSVSFITIGKKFGTVYNFFLQRKALRALQGKNSGQYTIFGANPHLTVVVSKMNCAILEMILGKIVYCPEFFY